jgi:hypothetical protein
MAVTMTQGGWKPIATAPRDGMTIFAAHWQTGQRGMVSFNKQGEWEMVNGLNNSPMGVGFYPTHWMHLPEQPVR